MIRELDALSNELHMISEHAVQLDANFSKYGYSAHLRTKDAPDSLYSSGESASFDKDTWHAERKLGESMRFYQKPIVRQYFHKGLLWRAKEAQEVASYELFIDLFYVGIIAITGDSAAEHPTGESLLRFAITFIMGWKFWSDIGVLISWFDSDDVLRRCSVLLILTCLLGFTTNMASAFEHTYTPLVAFYLAARLFMTTSLFWYAWTIPMVRGSMISNAVVSLIPAALWIGSIHVEEPNKQALIWVAIFFDIFGPFIMIFIQRPGPIMDRWVPRKLKDRLEFFPGTNIEHRIERTNAFVTLVFGSCVLGLLYQSNVPMGMNAFFGKAVLGLIQAFVFNWLYFEIDSFNLHTHAIRRHVFSGKQPLSSHSFHGRTNQKPSADMALHPPSLHNVFRAQRLRARRPRPRTRLCQRACRVSLRNLPAPLGRPHQRGLGMVLLWRTRRLALLPLHHFALPCPSQDPQPTSTQGNTTGVPHGRLSHHHMSAQSASQQSAVDSNDDGLGGVCANVGSGGHVVLGRKPVLGEGL